MNTGQKPEGLLLTEEEAYSLLSLCLTSPNGLDAISERALRKLAEYCTSGSNTSNTHIIQPRDHYRTRELGKAGA
jgi:hypothetical protein